MKQERTWKDVVVEALQQLGGQASLKEITELAQQDPKAEFNSKVREKVRQVVRAYKIFETVEEGSGIYRLVPEVATQDLNQEASTKSITDEIQGKLLYIGRVSNYETFAPADDRVKRQFAGHRLEHYVSVRDLSEHPRLKKEEVDIIERIDVLWLAEHDGDLLPRFAFEIENATKVLTGLNRLLRIPSLFQTRLFIVGDDERQRKRFDEHLGGPTFKARADRFKFRHFDEVRQLFEVSQTYDEARTAHQAALRAADLYE